jgi:squalene-associated FAD-dependent desaturase
VANVAIGVTGVDRIAVIGGGWAGCAAAVTLSRAGVPVALYEAAPVLGGRARRVPRAGLPLDNGQHLLLGAYASSLALLELVHGRDCAGRVVARSPLTIRPLAREQDRALTLVRNKAAGPLGLLTGLMSARGLTWRERVANVAWFLKLKRAGFACGSDETVAQLLAPLPRRVAQGLWEPLCLAALNTPPASASARIFVNVLKTAFAGAMEDSDFLLPTTDLTAVFPEAAARFVESHGGVVRTGVAARIVHATDHGTVLSVGQATETLRAVIVAVGPHQVAGAIDLEALSANPPLRTFVEQLAALAYEPIVTAWLGYTAAVPLPAAIARLDDAPGQWVVDRPDILANAQPDPDRPPLRPPLRQLLAVILSASGPHEHLGHDVLAREVDAQLRRLQPTRAACAWSQVIAERRATYACTPRRIRPGQVRLGAGVYIAGDYMDADYPATLEAAVRSGVAAAEAALMDAGQVAQRGAATAGHAYVP